MAKYSDVLRQYYSSSKWILRTDGNDQTSYDSLEWVDSSTKPTKAELDSHLSSVETEEMSVFRQMRNQKLLESDWTQGIDSPLDSSKKTEWQTYRQSLRDITNSYQSVDDAGFAWPTKPSS